MAGVTILTAQLTSAGLLLVQFTCRSRGASNWRHLLDAFEEALGTAPPHLRPSVYRVSPGATLGRGGQLQMPPMALAYVLARWKQSRSVQRALGANELELRVEALNPQALTRAERRLGEVSPLPEGADGGEEHVR
ncbi:hypothetical protein [Myxococcus sp. AM010]|uniref:hypothetical protein n=1 Tax=Myxococcus sp. AM010 TaxID=2745138 RepID=UPI0015954DB0|nr:hypothetical protein [Myxococcus sp. AM010]NVJ15180.1 hypothetical protein [Myxococcus sp. AM010]